MNDMRWTAQQLAARGRFGDTMLIHVNPAEVAGIASLIPGGLTINPETGLPEAFFFLPFLASMFGAAAPAATAAAAAAPAMLAGAGTAASALGAGVTSALGSAATGIGTALAAPVATAAEGIGALGTAASAAPVAAETLAPLAGATAGPLGAPLGTAALGATPFEVTTTTAAADVGAPLISGGVTTLPDAASASLLPAPGAAGIPSIAPTSLTSTPTIYTPASTAGPSSFAGQEVAPAIKAPVVETVKPIAVSSENAGPFSAPATTNADTLGLPKTMDVPGPKPETEGGGLSGMWDAIKKNPMLLGIAAQGLGGLASMFKGKEKKKKGKNVDNMKYAGGDASFPSSLSGYGTSSMPSEWKFYAARGGLVPGYANGGIVSLAEGGPVDPQMQMPQDMSFPLNGVPAGGGSDEAPMLEDIPSSNLPTSQIGSEPEPLPDNTAEASGHNDRELVAQTVEAIQGKLPDPRPVLLEFVKTFGEPALQDLAMRVKQMGPAAVAAAGDGQSDSVPAMIDGKQPAALSQGEFVVPADAVSHLGNGSTDAGAQHLQGMVDQVRQQRTGSPSQPPALNGGGLVKGYANGGIVALKEGGKVYSPEEWSWGDFLNPMSEPPRTYVESGPPGGAERGLNTPARQFPPDLKDAFDAERAISGSDLPEWIDEWIPSTQGAILGDPFMTAPEMRKEMARRDAARAKGN